MANKLWGGRFSKGINPIFEKFSSSIAVDYRLTECDLIGSFLHVYVLYGAKLISKSEFLALKNGIKALLLNIKKNVLKYDSSCEDVHTWIQNMLEKKVGKVVEKLQTCRSRNDQVVFDTRFYCLTEAVILHQMFFELNKSLEALGKQHASLVMPGYTHLQHAQPIYFKDYLKAYEAMFIEDAARLECFYSRLELTLGSGALAGTFIPATIYKTEIKKALKELGMDSSFYEVLPPKNSLVVVSDRDFVIEFLSILAIIGMHTSRLCEDLILWSTKEFDFIELSDEFCTGSSLMPQKKNPDALELMRGATGVLYGNLVSVLTTMKALPLSYNRDMQWDKQPLFCSLDIVRNEISMFYKLIGSIKIKKAAIERQLEDESLYATDLANYLVSKKLSFKEAHTIIGKLVRYSLDNSVKIKEMPQETLKKFSDKLVKNEIVKLFDAGFSVESKKSIKR